MLSHAAATVDGWAFDCWYRTTVGERVLDQITREDASKALRVRFTCMIPSRTAMPRLGDRFPALGVLSMRCTEPTAEP